MNVSILYRPNSEHERSVLTFQHDFKQQNGHDVNMVSLDTVEGDETARLYGILDYPAIIVTANDGMLQKLWQGSSLPLMDEVLSYAIE